MSLFSVLSDPNFLESMQRWLSLAVLYPELHYVFRYFRFSRYRIRQPEIVTDVPYRLDPGRQLPVLLLIKDADRFPVDLWSLRITVGNEEKMRQDFEINESLSAPWWHKVFHAEVPDHFRGQTIAVQTEIRFRSGKKECTVLQDNFPGLSHKPFMVHIAREPLPCPGDWAMGEIHMHSHYTSDQVEFGIPPAAAAELVKAMGLSFAAVTDHSYDLDDDEGNYLIRNPGLPKWKKLQDEIRTLNDKNDGFVLIPGEEVTCRNLRGKNVHCLVLNEPAYIPGSGDSAEKWFRTRSEHSISDLPGLVSGNALVIAAHPSESVPFLQRILINRGNWSPDDCETRGLHGLQILNGIRNESFYAGLNEWVRQLLAGRRIFIFGGNDAHGNFSRFRQVRFPMIALEEKDRYQIFGMAKTCVLTGSGGLSPDRLMEGLRQGRAIITDGPFISLKISNERNETEMTGGQIRGNMFYINIDSVSTEEFGRIESVRLFLGVTGGTEKCISEYQPQNYRFDSQIRLSNIISGYVRAELETEKGNYCYTNPVWVSK